MLHNSFFCKLTIILKTVSFHLDARLRRIQAQNREAATRYREKKRKEREEAKAIVDGLLDVNKKLNDKVKTALLY